MLLNYQCYEMIKTILPPFYTTVSCPPCPLKNKVGDHPTLPLYTTVCTGNISEQNLYS